MRTVRIKVPTIEQVEFTLSCEVEHSSIRGNCMASGDDEYDEQCAVDIEQQLDNGNDWAWCCVKVKAEWKGLKAADYLGCCSYESKEDFIENSGYYDDMKLTAYNELVKRIESLR